MATKEDKPKMTISEALNEITKFKNTFRAAEMLEDALLVVVNRDNAKNVAEREASTAQTRKKDAERELAAIEAEVKSRRAEADKTIAILHVNLENERQALERYKAQCKKEADDLRAAHDKVRQFIIEGTEQLDAKKNKLAREVRELEGQINPAANPAESSQARIEGVKQ
jgi:chromosome segregation ATPase